MKKIILFLLVFSSSAAISARFPHDLKWRTLKSEHFNIIYAEPNKPLAELYAAASEKAFAELAPLFGESPSTPLPVLLADSTDLANGSATFLPYALIIAYPVLPASGDTISYYENWVYELMIHELAHIFNMEPRHGFYAPFAYLFGTIVRPNAVLPRWYLEGLAVEIESRYTTHGRLRSPGTAATLRALTVGERWDKEPLENVNESSIPTWPFGQRPYLFGSLLWHSFTEQHGVQLIPELNQRFSRRVPFFLNQPFRDHEDLDLPARWENLRNELKQQTQAQIDLIQKPGTMSAIPFKEQEGQQAAPAISPNGAHLIYLSSPKFESAKLQLLTRQMPGGKSFSSESPHRLTEALGVTRLAWLPDSSGVIYDQISIYRRYYRYRDLYLLRLADKENPERLTFGERASEPAVSPNGKDIAYIRSRAGGTELVLMDLSTRIPRILLKPPLGLRLSQPTFRDEQNLVFIGRDSQAKDHVFNLNLKTMKRSSVVEVAPLINQVRQTPQGLLIAANRTGVSNLYLMKANQAPFAITNSATEINQGDYDPIAKEAIYTQLTSEGYRLFATPAKRHEPPLIEALPLTRYKTETTPRASVLLPRVNTKDEEYSAWRYLLPRYWIPFVYPVEDGIIFQGMNETYDPTERHTYNLSGSYDSVTRQFSYGARYQTSVFPVGLGFSAAETNELLAARSDSVTNQFYGVDSNFYLPGLSSAWSSGLQVSQINTEIPTASGSRDIDRLAVGAEIIYRSAQNEAVKPEWGENYFTLRHTSYVGGDDRLAYEKTYGLLGLRWRGPFPARHSLTLQAKGSTSPGLGLNNVVALGDRTIGGNYLVSLINSNFMLRGYPSGALVGRTLINTNVEYRFPAGDIYKGWGTFPLFLRNLEMALFIDSALVDGAYLSQDDLRFYRSRTDEIYNGTGLELTLAGTAAYHLPVTMTLGLYYGLEDKAGGGFMPFISLGYVGHGGVDKSSDTSTRLRPASFAR